MLVATRVESTDDPTNPNTLSHDQFRNMVNVRDWLVSAMLEHDKLESFAMDANTIEEHVQQRQNMHAALESVKDQLYNYS